MPAGRKLSPKNLAEAATALTAAISVADNLWHEANKDERIVRAGKAVARRVAEAAKPDPAQALRKKWAAADDFATTMAQDEANRDKVRGWRADLGVLRNKLALVEAQPGRSRRKAFKELHRQTAGLMATMLHHAAPAGLDSEQTQEDITS